MKKKNSEEKKTSAGLGDVDPPPHFIWVSAFTSVRRPLESGEKPPRRWLKHSFHAARTKNIEKHSGNINKQHFKKYTFGWKKALKKYKSICNFLKKKIPARGQFFVPAQARRTFAHDNMSVLGSYSTSSLRIYKNPDIRMSFRRNQGLGKFDGSSDGRVGGPNGPVICSGNSAPRFYLRTAHRHCELLSGLRTEVNAETQMGFHVAELQKRKKIMKRCKMI